jgi:threonine/homoserine efflux transporter RhtA
MIKKKTSIHILFISLFWQCLTGISLAVLVGAFWAGYILLVIAASMGSTVTSTK